MPRPLNTDQKLATIFQENDTEAQIVKKIQSGYLKGRAVTFVIDKLPNSATKIEFNLDKDKKINSFTLTHKDSNCSTFTQTNKLSRVPFCLRRWFWHNIKMKINSNYEKEFIQKATVLAKSYLATAKHPEATFSSSSAHGKKPTPPSKTSESSSSSSCENLNPNPADDLYLFETTPFKFSKKAFELKAKKQEFKGKLINNSEFLTLMNKHMAVFAGIGTGSHGDPYQNIIDAFQKGYGFTSVGGKGPLIANNAQLNNEIQEKMQELMTLISKKEKLSEQSLWLRRVGEQFRACNTDRVQAIIKYHSELLAPSGGFEVELEQKLRSFKKALFDRMLMEKFPQDNNPPIYLQIPHLTSGFLAVVGNTLGLEGIEAAATDVHMYQVPDNEGNQFIIEFKQRLQQSMDEFCMGVVTDINTSESEEGISCASYSKWHMDKADNSELTSAFSYYDKSKKPYYTKLNKQSEDQENGFFNYIAPAEVKQILAMLGYIEETGVM